MAQKVPVIFAIQNDTLLSGTEYEPLAGLGDTSSATEADVKYRIRIAGVFSMLRTFVTVTSGTPSAALSVRKNGSTQIIVATLTGTGAFTDSTNTLSVSAGDDVNYIYTTVTGQVGVSHARLLFEAGDGNTYMPYQTVLVGGLAFSATTRYPNINGEMSGATSEGATNQCYMWNAGVWSNLFVRVSANAKTVSTVYRSRKNNANGNQIVTFGSGATGLIEDTSNTDSVALGDLINYVIEITGSNAITTTSIGSIYKSTDPTLLTFFSAWRSGDRTASATTHYYHAFASGVITPQTTESRAKIQLGVAGTLSEFSLRAGTNTSTGTTTFRLRINGANGNQTFTVGASATGLFTDTSNSDAVVATDDINVSVSGGTSGILTMAGFSHRFAMPSAGVTVTPAVKSLVFSLPSITKIMTIKPNVVSAVFSLPSRKIIITTKPNVATLVFSLPARTLILTVKVLPNALSVVASLPTRTLIMTYRVNVLSAVFSLPSRTVSTGSKVISSVLTAVFSLPSRTIIMLVKPNVASAVFSLPSRKIIMTIKPNVLSAVFSLPSRTIITPSFVTVTPAVKSLVFSQPSRNVFIPRSLGLVASSSQYASIANASQTGLGITGDITIQAWVRFTTLPSSGNRMMIVSKNGGTSNRAWYFALYNSSGTLRLQLYSSSSGSNEDSEEVDFTPVTGIWYHVAVTQTGTSIKFYVNGRQKGSTITGSFSSFASNSEDVIVGAGKTTSTSIGSYLDGFIDNVRIFNDVRTQAEIDTDAHAITVSDANLKAEWRFDNQYADTSGNNNNLTASGSPSFSTNLPWEHTSQVQSSTYLETNLIAYWALENTSDSKGTRTLTNNGTTTFPAGKVNNGASFNGSSKYLSRATETLGIANVWSVAQWVKFNATGVNEFLTTWLPSSTQNNQIQITKMTTDVLRVVIVDPSSGNFKDYRGQTTMTTGVYYHIVATWDGTYLELYINGVREDLTKSLDQSVTQTDTSRIVGIGGWNGSSFGNVVMDEVSYWSRSLHYGDILDLYADGVGITYAPPIPITVTPNALSAVFSLPSRTTRVTKTVSVQSAVFSLPSRTVITTGGATIAVAVKSCVFSIPSRAVLLGIRVSANVQTATFSIPPYSVTAKQSVIMAVAVKVLTFSIPAFHARGDFWQDKFPSASKSWSDKFSQPATGWSDKFPSATKGWVDKY